MFVDLNNDKKFEIVTYLWTTGYVDVLAEYHVAEFTNRTAYFTVSVLHFGLTNGSLHIQQVLQIGSDAFPRYVITIDINKDKYMDIVSVNAKSNTLKVH